MMHILWNSCGIAHVGSSKRHQSEQRRTPQKQYGVVVAALAAVEAISILAREPKVVGMHTWYSVKLHRYSAPNKYLYTGEAATLRAATR